MTGKAFYNTLELTDARDIHGAFLSAFSDYSVKVDMPFGKFTSFLKANGFMPSLSAGVFTDGKLRAFILNGVREYGGALTAYDGGTGAVPEYRRRGFVRGMFGFCLPLLRAAGVKNYVLEVIQSNEPAFALYKSFGFSIRRELICYRIKKDGLKQGAAADKADTGDIGADVQALWDYCPAWQNTFDSINAVREQCAAAVVRKAGLTVGYGVINVKSGRVYQLAVKDEYRRRGLGQGLLRALAEKVETEDIVFLNVDGGCPSMRGFLEKQGFEEHVRQYEMTMDI